MKIKLKILFLILAFYFATFEASSQTIAVKSFRKLETDQEARIVSPKTDQNGKKCAIIKVVTSQIGFVFDFGMIGNAVATEQKTGEIWVWVPAGARKVTINHQQLGVLRNYPFDIDIEEASVYEMVLITGKVEITVKEDQIALQWLVINSTPSGADLYIDDQAANQSPYQRELPLGKHTYRLSHDMYLPTAGSIFLNADKKEVINSVLKPDFGKLNISLLMKMALWSILMDSQQEKLHPAL
jgi:PEGA domain